MAETDGFAPLDFFSFDEVSFADAPSSFDIFSLPSPVANGAVETFDTGDDDAGFFDRIGSTFGGIFNLLGSGVEAVGKLDATTRNVTGEGILPDRKQRPAASFQAGEWTCILLFAGNEGQ